MNRSYSKYFAEGIGTFILVFCGTCAIAVDQLYPGTIGHTGIALTFGLVVMVVVYAIGSFSGAHINPAVSLAFYVSGRFSGKKLLPYILAQSIGAVMASFTLALLLNPPTLGATLPAKELSISQAVIIEVILTFVLMFVIIHVATGIKEIGATAGIAIGGAVALDALFAGPLTGASMNPARSLGPALISGNLHDLWIYLVAPSVGAVLAVLFWKHIVHPARQKG